VVESHPDGMIIADLIDMSHPEADSNPRAAKQRFQNRIANGNECHLWQVVHAIEA